MALEAIANSVYPGQRSTASGGGSAVLMFDAPLDVFTIHGASPVVSKTNQSEAASGLMLWLPIMIVGGGFAGIRSRSGAAKALAATLIAGAVFAAWAILPVPTWLGGLLGLTSVQGSRMVVPLTVAGAIAAGLYVHRVRTDGAFRPERSRIVIGAASFIFVSGWAATQSSINDLPLARASVLLLIALFGIVTALILNGKAVLGLGGACLLLLFSTARVNPLQVGLSPLTQNPLLRQVEQIEATDASARWASDHGDIVGFAVLAASGVKTATGVDLYAVPDTWHLIDRHDAAEPTWNRFANIDLSIDNTVATTQIELAQADLILIATPSCNGALQALDITFVTESEPVSMPCLREVAAASTPGERWIYEVVTT